MPVGMPYVAPTPPGEDDAPFPSPDAIRIPSCPDAILLASDLSDGHVSGSLTSLDISCSGEYVMRSEDSPMMVLIRF